MYIIENGSCSHCKNRDCTRCVRNINEGFNIVSDFDYVLTDESGVCVDIGTTTIAAVNIENGKVIAKYSELNDQRRFGTDVISRIDASNRGHRDELCSIMNSQSDRVISKVGGEGKRCIISANTAMVSLLMGYDTKELGMYPFKAQSLETVCIGNRTIIGGISAFIGGDIISGLYMTGVCEREQVSLFIDLGTNGEMVIGNKNKILCTSAAAGPAFEGGMISCGTGSVDGAVCAVDFAENKIETIGNKPPCGICGTGIIEIVSELKKTDIIDKTGLFSSDYENGYPLTDKIIFTQRDIREVQTAKSAIRTGIELLIREYGCSKDDIENVYIAGGFGQRLNIEKAVDIGLLPSDLKCKCHAVGNSALGGGARLLKNGNAVDEINKICSKAVDFPLAEHKDFEQMFLKYMEFGDD